MARKDGRTATKGDNIRRWQWWWWCWQQTRATKVISAMKDRPIIIVNIFEGCWVTDREWRPQKQEEEEDGAAGNDNDSRWWVTKMDDNGGDSDGRLWGDGRRLDEGTKGETWELAWLLDMRKWYEFMGLSFFLVNNWDLITLTNWGEIWG